MADAWALAIETSNPSSREGSPASGVAAGVLGADGLASRVVEKPIAPGARHDDGLMPAIERLRGRLGVEPGGLARIAVSIGPGGYTGLRVAATTAMLLADATGAEAVPVPSALVVAASVVGSGRASGAFAVALASKRGVVHLTRFDDPRDPLSFREIGLVDESDLEGLKVELLIADRHLPTLIRLRANTLGLQIEEPRFSAAACLDIGFGLPAASGGRLSPVYAREPEAVRLWRSRHPGLGL